MVDRRIVFDVERMKYPNTGLFHFCKNLGDNLLSQCPIGSEMYFFQNNKSPDYFGRETSYVRQYSYQKFIKPSFSQYDLWHSTFQLSSYLPTSKKIKIVSTIHDLNFLHEHKSEKKVKKYLDKVQNTIDRSDVIVAISNFVKDEIMKYCEVGNKPVEVIYNGNNIDPSLLIKFDLSSPLINDDYIFSIGTINSKKNFHVLLYLLLGNNLKLVISGIISEKEYYEKMIALASQLGVLDRLIFTGAISEKDKYNYLKYCSLFAFPSIAEGFGLPVVEAMTFGKKVLLSKETSLPEIGGKEAFYLEEMSSEYLENFAKRDFINIINAESREQQIKQWASQFSWEGAATKYWKIYNDLLK